MSQSNITAPQDVIVWRQDFARRMNVTSEAVRRWVRDNKLPPPDVKLSMRTMGWKMSTLAAAGIRLP